MVTVKMLKPYYIKTDHEYVRIVLAYQYFSVVIRDKDYQFIPIEANEIRINRKTQKVENVEAKFAFQNGKDVVYLTMAKLITLPDFLQQLHSIASTYYINEAQESSKEQNIESAIIIEELEKLNVKRLIDKALDEHDEAAFYQLTKYLSNH
ncbi:IDEAL domain-containing protein [Oceanobacillus piezotolerans]|uniref:IDEAL domain-containing protein n=1 Tax=Oceanobacillus piezotolerans TaxID=2448030 RepID=A0A498DFG4_9BACI|nr:IDEAL domain-containing protein [Oceanobacillus piezotolerans]RLL46671.1 IDEAL domain-containing protein [Oceanobacillus piezotolerans]